MYIYSNCYFQACIPRTMVFWTITCLTQRLETNFAWIQLALPMTRRENTDGGNNTYHCGPVPQMKVNIRLENTVDIAIFLTVIEQAYIVLLMRIPL